MPPAELLAITAIIFATLCWGLLVLTLCKALSLKRKCERLQKNLDILRDLDCCAASHLRVVLKANRAYQKEIKRLNAVIDEEVKHGA